MKNINTTEIATELKDKYGQYLSRKQIAEELCVSPQTIRRAERDGRLSAVKLSFRCIRYPVASVADYITRSFDHLT